MELYIQVAFWLGIVGILLRAFMISNLSYPRTSTATIGQDMTTTLVQIVFVVWAGFLLYT